MDQAKTLKLQFRVGDLDLPERRKRYSHTSSREEEEDARQQSRVQLTKWENVNVYKEERVC